MVQLPPPSGNKRIIETGKFEFETYLSRSELIEFLRELANQLEKGNEVTVSTDEWEVMLEFTEPVEVEVDYNGYAKKLEFEIEFRQRPKIMFRQRPR